MGDFDNYIAKREKKDTQFKQLRNELRPLFEFRKALIGARLAANLTQKELAEKMGTKQSAIARLESGNQAPNLDTLLKLTKALGVDFTIAKGKLAMIPHKAA